MVGRRQRRSDFPSPRRPTNGGCRVEITLTLPDDLASRLRPVQSHLPHILELGIREWSARGDPGFAGLGGVLEVLAALPTPEEVLALRPSAALQERIDYMVEKGRSGSLSTAAPREWQQYQYD